VADEGESDKAKKERVLHTRVPAVLEDELKKLATNLKVPVSNLVRAILEDAIDAVDAGVQKAEGELHGIAERLAKQRDSLRSAAAKSATSRVEEAREGASCPESDASIEGVIGFQSIVLASASACTVCGRALGKGARACRGVRDDGGPKVLVANGCALVPAGNE
jgi:hypothetical protein